MKDDILAQLSIRRLRPDGKGRHSDSSLKGCRPLPTFEPLSSVINPGFVTFAREQEIDFVQILLLADFLIHFELVSMRKLAEGDEYSNAEYQNEAFQQIHSLLQGRSQRKCKLWKILLIN